MFRLQHAILLILLAGFPLLANAQNTNPEQLAGGKIQHVVIIYQENRSTDNLFHDPVLIKRGADIASVGQSQNGPITLTAVPLVTKYDLDHGHMAFLNSCDWNGSKCLMDGANQDSCSPPSKCPPNPPYHYVRSTDVEPYFFMAETYAFGDRMFQTNEGPSFPAHQYILSGTSTISTSSSIYVAGLPTNNERSDGKAFAGCLAPPGSEVFTIDTSQPFPNADLSQFGGAECFEHPTLTDLLDKANLSWKYYTVSEGSIWTSPNVIEHMCVPKGGPEDTSCSGSDWTGKNPKVVIEGTKAKILTDIQKGYLAAVTWVIPDGQASDHASLNKGLGPSWVASIVNAIGTSSFWKNTAIIVTWDDWGGWYDHVAPPIRNSGSHQNSYEYGFRVPIIVISPYVKAAYVSHQMNDVGSILKFIEETFSLSQIDPQVGYADSYALGDLSDFFNFSQTPLQFTQVPAPHDAKFFINRKGKPTPPDND